VTASRPAIVIDASVIVKWYLPEIYSEESLKLLDEYEIHTVDVAIPQVATALSKRIRTGEVKGHEGKRIMENLVKLPIHFAPMDTLASNAIELGSITSRSFNESLYFVLALRRQTKLITADFRWYGMLSTGKLKKYVAFVNEPDQFKL
jgi:predicted nucleic acid-binding protein